MINPTPIHLSSRDAKSLMDSSVNYSSTATAAHIVKHYAYGPDLLHSDLQYI